MFLEDNFGNILSKSFPKSIITALSHFFVHIKQFILTGILIPRRHSLAFIAATIVGIVCITPQITFITRLGFEYKGIYILKSDAETHYLARMKNSAEGNGIGNPFMREYSHEPSATWSYSEWLLSVPSRVFDISVSNISLLYKFILPAIATLCVYGCLFFITRNQLWASVGSIAIIIGSALVNTSDIINLFTWNETYSQFLAYSRPINPQFSGIIFFAYFLSLLYALKNRSRSAFALVALISAISWYVYFYTATFILAMNFVVIAGFITHYILLTYSKYIPTKIADALIKIFSDSVIPETAKDVVRSLRYSLIATIMSVFGGAPFIWATYRLMSSPYYEELARVAHITSSRTPVISSAWIATSIIFVLTVWLFPKFTRIFVYILLATLISVNQQVLTGIVLQQGHYHWYTNAPLFVLVIWVCIFTLINLVKSLRMRNVLVYITALSCFITVIAYGTLVQSSSYKARAHETTYDQRYVPLLIWLKNNTPAESTILAHNGVSELIPIYTNNTVAWENHATYYLMSHTRREFTPENILQSPAPHDIIKNYPLDYLVQDSAKPFNIPKTFPARTIAQFGDFTIYKVQR